MTDITHFLLCYLFAVLMGTLVVAGFFQVTRGRWETRPDGRRIKKGQLLKGWWFYWNQEFPQTEKVYYRDQQLRILYTSMRSHFYRGGENDLILHKGTVEIRNPDMYLSRGVIQLLETEHHVKMEEKGTNLYAVYKEYPLYIFPEWVRKPLANCPTCFASVYGSWFYWILTLFSGKYLFACFQYPILAMLFFWVCFCLSLAVTLTAVAKKLN